ncbi:unnamed protein product [Amaranthus hypochondriacus]
MTANDLGDIKMDGSNLPLKKEDCPMLAPPVTYDRMKGPLPGTSDDNHTGAMESSSSKQGGLTFSGLEPPCVSSQPSEQTNHVVMNSKIENYKDHVLDLARFPRSKDLIIRKGQWPHLYQMVGGPKLTESPGDPLSRAQDKLMVSMREHSRKGDADAWNLRHMKANHIDETGKVCIDTMHGKDLNSDTALLPQDARSRILSTSSFSHFFGKKTTKGKGIINGQPGVKTDHDNFSYVQMQRLQCSNSGIVSNAGVSLREWLKTGPSEKNKVQSLSLFRQIAELVSSAHSQGVVLQQLWPSYFVILPSNKVKYIGSLTQIDSHVPQSLVGCKKRPPEENISAFCIPGVKHKKLSQDMEMQNHPSPATLVNGFKTPKVWKTRYDEVSSSGSQNPDNKALAIVRHQATRSEKSLPTDLQVEEKWYSCPEEIDGKACSFSSNIYCLGVILFELLCPFDSMEAHSAAMFDLNYRILPPFFLSENAKEAGFCLWLIHPNPSSRPTISEILLSDLICGSQELNVNDELTIATDNVDMAESELLLDFLVSLKEKEEDKAVKLVEDIRCIEADIKGLQGKFSYMVSPRLANRDYNLQDFIKSIARSGSNEDILRNDLKQLEKAYFSLRSQTTVATGTSRADKSFLKKRETSSLVQNEKEMSSMDNKCATGLDVFFEGLCKFTCYSKFELRGTLRNSDLLNSANVIFSLSFDRDEEYIAVAGASKRIKIFEYSALVNDTIDIHYPVIEMVNKSKLSCISWNSYIRNYLASTDYDGVVQVWDASTGVGYSQYTEHQKRAWSIDFSRVDPTKFASGSDDCSVKLWCTNDKQSTCTIWSPANVCCVQFSPYSSHLLMFGSADHKIYGYDLRHMRIPWCTLAGHEKTVSYVKFLDSETLISASTDNTLKLWDLSKTSLSGMSSDACHLTFSGHTNKKHFVGLSVLDGYIACGSETNEVYTYYRSLPMPIASYKLSSIHPISQLDVREDGLFVSSVCWRRKSNTVLAANSSGSVRLLQLV